MCSIYRILVLGFLPIVFISSTPAQQLDEILFGTYLPSSNFPEITYHRFNDTNLVKLGFNTIFQTVMHKDSHKDSITFYIRAEKKIWKDNREALGSSSFDNIVAMNGMWVRNDTKRHPNRATLPVEYIFILLE